MSKVIWIKGRATRENDSMRRLTGNIVVYTDMVCRPLGAAFHHILKELPRNDYMLLTVSLKGWYVGEFTLAIEVVGAKVDAYRCICQPSYAKV